MEAMNASLQALLAAAGISDDRIEAVLDSGYFLKLWEDPLSGKTHTTVSDALYGNKQFSSSFEIDKFVA